jgi:uridine kinase
MKNEILKKIKQKVEANNLPNGLPVKIIAIDGRGGAGKSTLADKLAEELNAEILHTDDFASWDNSTNWWPRVIEDVFEPIKAGAKTLSYARSSWAPNHHPEPIKDQLVTPTMILEGVSSARKEFRPYLTYAIWVETPKELCLKRGLERDGQDALPVWQKWIKQEDEYIARDNPRAYADIEIGGADEQK